ncbi:MAG: WGR domain-containing protein [Myxococcales bacterium]
MPRYEFSEGTSNKFWDISLDGTSVTTTYGRIGTDGQTSLKEFDSEAKAKKEHDKLVAEKVKKGYRLVSGAPATAAPPAPATSKPAKAKAPVFEDEGDDEPAPPKKAAAKAPEAPAKKPSAPAKTAGARTFEFVEGSSSKFWEIRREDCAVFTRYGRIGAAGQETMKDFDSPEKAAKEYDKLLAEKQKKGYVEK